MNHWIVINRLRKLKEWQDKWTFKPLGDAIRELKQIFPNDKIKLANRGDQIVVLIGKDLLAKI